MTRIGQKGEKGHTPPPRREEEGQEERYARRAGRKGLENGEDSRVQTAQTMVSRKIKTNKQKHVIGFSI